MSDTDLASPDYGSVLKAPPSPADALFTATQQRVLGLLFGQPDRSFFQSELIRLAKVGSGTVQREVERLVASGLVSVTIIGRQKHYRANRDSPVYRELRSLIRKTVGMAEPLRAGLAPLAARTKLAIVAGSTVKATGAVPSDVELLLVGDDLTLDEIRRALASVEDALGCRISPTLYTLAEFRRQRRTENGFVYRVLSGDYLMVIRNERR